MMRHWQRTRRLSVVVRARHCVIERVQGNKARAAGHAMLHRGLLPAQVLAVNVLDWLLQGGFPFDFVS